MRRLVAQSFKFKLGWNIWHLFCTSNSGIWWCRVSEVKVKGQHHPDTCPKTTLHKIILPSTIREWNSHPMEVRKSPTLFKFKTHILNYFPPPVKQTWFNTGSNFLNIHHARIRLSCSKLKIRSSLQYFFVEDDLFCTGWLKMRIIIFQNITIVDKGS